jgi:threonine/homoserine/homoserine lactone efflux protein
MTITLDQFLLYTGALVILFATPGPVWLAVTARALSGGFPAAFPVALGVVVGDILWPFLAILGVTWVVSQYADFMMVLRWIASIMFIGMGIMVLRRAGRRITADSRLTQPGNWAGFVAGVAVILGNPKAILFYMGVLPGFFDLTRLTWPDIAVIVAISIVIPLIGNTLLAIFVGRARAVLGTPKALWRMNLTAGILLVLVGLVIPLT